MKLERINKNNPPDLVIITTEPLVANKQLLMKHYLLPLQEFKTTTQVLTIDMPKSGKLRKAEFEEEWQQIQNYLDTNGVTNIAVTIPDLMKHLTGSKKAYRFEVAQGSVEKVNGLNIFPLLNYQVLKFAPLKIELLNASLDAIRNTLRGNVSDDSIIDNIKLNLMYTNPSKIKRVLTQLLDKSILTCDIETTGLRFEADSILTISFAWDEEHAVSIGVHEKYHSLEDYNQIVQLLQDFFNSYNKNGGVFLGHNFAMFDMPFIVHEIMRKRDWSIPQFKILDSFNIKDTLVMAWIAKNSTDRPTIDLKSLAYYKMGNYDADIDQKNLVDYSFEDVAYYNNLDCIANWVVYKDLLQEYEQTPHYWELFNKYDRIQTVIANMQMQGLVVDLEKVDKAAKDLDELVAGVFKSLEDFVEYRQTKMELSEIACKKYNDSHVKQKVTEDFSIDFKPNSGAHKTVLFQDVLGIMSPKKSKTTGAPSWDKEVLNFIAEGKHKVGAKIAKLLLEFNQASIVNNTFLKGFRELSFKVGDEYKLFTHFKLNGTVSSRLSSSSPNFANMPANSTWGELIQSCFPAPKGFVFSGADFTNLEGYGLNNVSHDSLLNKMLTEGYDTHCTNCALYFKSQLEERGIFIDMDSVESVNSIAELAPDLRQESKKVTFGISYGAGVPKIATTLGIPQQEAQTIYDNYWNGYSGVREYYDKAIAFAEENGYVESEFSGLRLRTPNINSDDEFIKEAEIRLLCNFMIQSSAFQLLENLTDFMYWVQENGYENDIFPVNSVYDSIYSYIREDSDLIAILNNKFIEVMTKENLPNQLQKNKIQMELSYDWAHHTEIPIHSTKQDIEKALANYK